MLSWIAMLYDYDLVAAAQHEQRALACNPHNSFVQVWRSLRLLLTEQFSESIAAARLAVELDPLSPLVQQQLAFVLYHARQPEEGVAVYRRLIAADPRDGLSRGSLSWALRNLQQYDAAIQQAEKGAALFGEAPQSMLVLALAYAEAGKQKEATEVLQRLKASPAVQYVSPYHQGLVPLSLGKIDASFALFEQAFDLRDPWTVLFGIEPQLDVIRQDERYQKLLQRIRR